MTDNKGKGESKSSIQGTETDGGGGENPSKVMACGAQRTEEWTYYT